MSDSKEINHKYYEKIVLSKGIFYEDTIKAMDIVKRFILREKKILVGGMAIDMALKLKNPNNGIYDKGGIPDYDFYSDQHFKDAYDIAQWLNRLNFKNISIINAMHPSSMRVRVNFTVVADITYIPKNILKNIPTLRYKGFNIVHPHFQMIDQHRSLSYPYENPPYETISYRSKKDMIRYDLLYESYPLKLFNTDHTSISLIDAKKMDISILENTCITGFLALNYWLSAAQNLGFKPSKTFGIFKINGKELQYSIPVDSHGVTLYTDDIIGVYQKIKGKYKITEERFYEKFLDKLPRKVIINNEFELFENEQLIAAHKLIYDNQPSPPNNIYIANLQNIMMYLLVNYIILMKMKNIKRGYSFYMGYLTCRDLIIWASNKFYSKIWDKADKNIILGQFFPTHDVYGSKNISESFKVSKINFDYKNKSSTEKVDKQPYRQPKHVYDRDLKFRKVPKKYYLFSYENSLIFNLGGELINNFMEKNNVAA